MEGATSQRKAQSRHDLTTATSSRRDSTLKYGMHVHVIEFVGWSLSFLKVVSKDWYCIHNRSNRSYLEFVWKYSLTMSEQHLLPTFNQEPTLHIFLMQQCCENLLQTKWHQRISLPNFVSGPKIQVVENCYLIADEQNRHFWDPLHALSYVLCIINACRKCILSQIFSYETKQWTSFIKRKDWVMHMIAKKKKIWCWQVKNWAANIIAKLWAKFSKFQIPENGWCLTVWPCWFGEYKGSSWGSEVVCVICKNDSVKYNGLRSEGLRSEVFVRVICKEIPLHWPL